MKVTEYMILADENVEGLTEQVNEAIHDEWQPWGTPYTDNNSEACQAMVKWGGE